VEVTSASRPSAPVRGSLDVRVVDTNGRMPFTASSERTVIGSVTVTSVAELVPF
jgi:hypothetical protein